MKPGRPSAILAGILAVIGAVVGSMPIDGAVAEPASRVSPGGGAAQAFDFLIENVCLDAGGKVLIGVSPIDGDPRCVAQRDLRPGEPLAYHEREWPAETERGYARRGRGSDSFPVRTGALGTVAIHLFDLQRRLPGAAFDQYDPAARVGGGAIADVSNETASFVATELGRQDLKLFVGRGCRPGQPVTAAALQDSWVLAPLDRLSSLALPGVVPDDSNPIAGGILSTPSHIVDAGEGARCPARMSWGTTRWSVRPVTYRAVYRAGPEAGEHVRLWTLIAERTGRSPNRLDGAVAFERAYFTRELGWTRWEGWKSTHARFRGVRHWAATTSEGENQRVVSAHDRVVRAGNCGFPESRAAQSGFAMPAAPTDSRGVPRADMAIVGCIEVTDIVPPQNKEGDPAPTGPGSWWYSIVSNTALPVAALLRH